MISTQLTEEKSKIIQPRDLKGVFYRNGIIYDVNHNEIYKMSTRTRCKNKATEETPSSVKLFNFYCALWDMQTSYTRSMDNISDFNLSTPGSEHCSSELSSPSCDFDSWSPHQWGNGYSRVSDCKMYKFHYALLQARWEQLKSQEKVHWRLSRSDEEDSDDSEIETDSEDCTFHNPVKLNIKSLKSLQARRNDREEIRRKLAMGDEDYYGGERTLRKPNLQTRLQGGMNLQVS